MSLPVGVLDRAADLLLSAASFRHGVVLEPQVSSPGAADVPGIFHVGVPAKTADGAWCTAAGGVGRDLASARLAAVGEALERYAAATCPLPGRTYSELVGESLVGASESSPANPEQAADPAAWFAGLYGGRAPYTRAYSVYDNAPVWVPADLVGLGGEGGFATSSGLAAATTSVRALLRGIEELVERDALMITWLHSVPGRQVALPERYVQDVRALGGRVTCIDATPAYSPHPVALVAGSLPLRGRERYSLGAACRSTWEDAVEKAFLEWAQGVFFVGEYLAHHPGLRFESYDDVDTFDAHAVYYTTAPEEWAKIPLLQGEAAPAPVGAGSPASTTRDQLERLLEGLRGEGIRMWYRDLTTTDLGQVGLHAVRVLSPDLTPIFCHADHRLRGGRIPDVLWRYPWARHQRLRFPNPMPHPLG